MSRGAAITDFSVGFEIGFGKALSALLIGECMLPLQPQQLFNRAMVPTRLPQLGDHAGSIGFYRLS